MSNKFYLLTIIVTAWVLGVTSCKQTTTTDTKETTEENTHQYTNHLVDESSPYLLQHAHNPVDWHPWGEEALAKAKAENKMLIISIGYAACHWCHVMEHESFEDTIVAKLMNEHFINIKVDREERPDIDDIYMTACHLSSDGSCGWPLNAFALPDGRPVWAGTYFPKNDWTRILQNFIDMREQQPQKLEEYATQLTQGIQVNSTVALKEGDYNFTQQKLDDIVSKYLNNIDMRQGGRQGSPKFPMPNNYEFLLDYHYRTGNQTALDAVTITLDKMEQGGIYDHIGGGFARYSTDAHWIVPHFEKMLYDNGQLVSLYAQAYAMTGKKRYKEVVEETLEYISREMTNSSGGFYSSLDADSEGEEGKFYVWQKTTIDSLLKDEKLASLYCDYYSVKEKGNWEHVNILHPTLSLEEFAQKNNLDAAQWQKDLQSANALLFSHRSNRIRPGLDDKILTSWNALMLKGYIDAYKYLGHEKYKEAALHNALFLVDNMMDSNFRLNRNYKDGKSSINAFLDDYAQLANAFMALYEITFDEEWLKKAEGLVEYSIAHFYDNDTKMFNYTSDLDPALVARKMEVADNVIPSSNSSMARVLARLGTYLYKADYIEKAQQMMLNVEDSIVDNDRPNFYSNWCQLYATLASPPYEVAILGDDYDKELRLFNKNYLPNTIVLGGKTEGSLELLKDKLVEGEIMIYVCQNKVCKFPVQETEKALKLIEK